MDNVELIARATLRAAGMQLQEDDVLAVVARVRDALDTDDALRRRNDGLRAVHSLLAPMSTPRFHRVLIDFEARVWPRWRALAEPPAGATELQRRLFVVFSAAAAVPDAHGNPAIPGRRQLDRIFGTSAVVDVPDRRAA